MTQRNILANFSDYAFVIQARLGSVRLPGKILLAFGQSTVLGTLVESLLAYGVPKRNIVVATSDNALDDLTTAHVHDLGLSTVRGSESDVLARYQVVAQRIEVGNIVRITADNPLPNGRLIEHCIRCHERDQPDLTSTRVVHPSGEVERYAPKGSSIDIIKKSSLLAIDRTLCSAFEKEHVIPHFYGNLKVSIVKDFAIDRPELSIDTLDDYVRVSLLLKQNVEQLMPWLHQGLFNGKLLGSSTGPMEDR